MKQRKKSFGMRISAFVLSFAMVCTLLAGVNVVAFAAETDEELTDTVSVLRAYNPNNGEHLMTIDEAEYNANVARGYSGEGEAWVAPIYSETEVWRAYNPNSGEHMLAPQAEVVALSQAGWQNEGLKMYSDDNMGVPIYRVFNPNATDAGSHHYCGEEEAAALVELGWQWDNNGEPVIYGVEEEPPVILVKLTDAEQLSANSVEVTFDQPATGLVDKGDITVAAADGTLVLPINSMVLSEDGMSATIDLAIAFTDEKDYVVELNGSEVTFTASVGDVATVVVLTASAKQNESTPIEYALYDEQGIDVTSTVKLSKTVSIDVEGDDVVPDVTNPNKPSLTMGTVGETATVTITYNSNEVDAEDVVGVGEITCVEAEALVGTGIYYDIDENDAATADLYVNANSGCAKFYWGLIQTTPVKVEEGDTNQEIYWCAGDLSTMTVYDYDEYEVESSDDSVMSVEVAPTTTDGKYVKLDVTGNEIGSANVVITATKNEKETVYTIPVVVTDEAELKSVTMTVDKSTVSNAFDVEYYGVATVKAIDTNGNTMKPGEYSVAFENDPDNEGKDVWSEALAVADQAAIDGLLANYSDVFDTTFQVYDMATIATDTKQTIPALVSEMGLKENQAVYTAFGAKKSTNKINAEISAGDVVKEKSVAVSVKEVDSAAWNSVANAASNGVDVSYKVELSATNVNEFSTPYTKARLAAYYKNLFVGYVRGTATTNNAAYVGMSGYQYNNQPNETAVYAGGARTGGAIIVSDAKKIGNLKVAVKSGNKLGEFSQTGLLGAISLLNMNNIQTNYAGGGAGLEGTILNPFAMTVVTGVNTSTPATALKMSIGDGKYDADFARPGEYSIYYKYDQDISGGIYADTDVSLTQKIKVTNAISDNSMYPQITVTSLNVESISEQDIKDNLVARCDINNNEAVNDSIIGLAQKDYSNPNYTGTKCTVKYAIAEETFGNWPDALTAGAATPLKVTFYVPINAQFIEE